MSKSDILGHLPVLVYVTVFKSAVASIQGEPFPNECLLALELFPPTPQQSKVLLGKLYQLAMDSQHLKQLAPKQELDFVQRIRSVIADLDVLPSEERERDRAVWCLEIRIDSLIREQREKLIKAEQQGGANAPATS